MMAQRVAINNLADSYMAFNTNYHDTGLFGFYATADPKHQAVDDLVWLHIHYLNLPVWMAVSICSLLAHAAFKHAHPVMAEASHDWTARVLVCHSMQCSKNGEVGCFCCRRGA